MFLEFLAEYGDVLASDIAKGVGIPQRGFVQVEEDARQRPRGGERRRWSQRSYENLPPSVTRGDGLHVPTSKCSESEMDVTVLAA